MKWFRHLKLETVRLNFIMKCMTQVYCCCV
uniref:Uncharacterized protein n=1 Tax=Rhizophora mucronata TaxID=61149 RepID=A0A2P2Q209_RHIMU